MKLARNILTTLSARTLVLGVALFTSVVLARVLGPEGRGLFALVLMLPELAKSLGLLGFDDANAVYAGLEPRRRQALVWHSVAFAGLVGGAFALAGALFLALGAPGFPALLRGPLWLYLLSISAVPFGLLSEYWYNILRGMNRIFMLNLVEVGTKVVMLILAVAFLVGLRLGVTGAVWANYLPTIGTTVLMLALLAHVGVWGKPTFDRPLWWRSVRFALPAYGHTVAAYLNYRLDEVIIAMLLPPQQLGFYVIAVGLVERLWILPGSVANALLPHLTNSRERDPALSAGVCRHVMVWVGTGCLLLFALAGMVVRVLYSSDFAPAVAPLRWLLLGIFTLSIGRVLEEELLAQEKPRYMVLASGLAVFVNLAGNLVLVPRMGISGAAIASSISYSLQALIVTGYYLRLTRLSWTVLCPRRSDLLVYLTAWRQLRLRRPSGEGRTEAPGT